MKKLLVTLIFIIVISSGCTGKDTGKSDNTIYSVVKGIPAQISNTAGEGLIPGGYIQAYVSRVVDGDTLLVTYKQKDYRVRLLDIDTPESVKKGVAVQQYAKEASKFTQKVSDGESVKLIFEKGLRDKYDRLLAHVFLKDDTYLNAILVKNGYARAEILPPNTVLEDYFLGLQKTAIENKKGLWSLPEDKRPFVKNDSGEYVPRYWLAEDAS